ncbi:MAG: nitrate reductase molybdenum cofactor assembly chaperone [Gammaproteobacteria bacterium]|nr:nitrate reductase molybdenum cofactor assembly chaperone [Gammaproteobacteria bacterium]
MKILKVLSLMMSYPTAELQTYNSELEEIINSSQDLSPSDRIKLLTLLHAIRDQDLMDLQEDYDSLFERGRSTSMLLFEHVHGESRDRGQAMVDLMALYENAGYEVTVRELPDHLPLYLEFFSTRPAEEAKEGIQDIEHIVGILGERLKQRESHYHHCFDVLLSVSGASLDAQQLEEQVSKEERDDTLEAMDKVWEDEMVTFTTTDPSSSSGCATTNAPQMTKPAVPVSPVHWVDAASSASK